MPMKSPPIHKDTPFIAILMCILFVVSIYLINATNDNVALLVERHRQLDDKVSTIRIKSDDAIRQQRRILIDIYSSQIQEAKSIASQAWFDYDNLIFVDISWINMNVVRLANWRKDWELEVNIQSKVITKF